MEWKEIKGTNGLYSVSESGCVFSTRSDRLIKPYKMKNGYWRVELNINGEAKRYFVHRLVAEAFIPNPNNYPIVNHKDENPSNNHVSNLEWCTFKYNSNYGTCQERIQAHRQTPLGKDNPQSKIVYQYDLQGNFIKKYDSCADAARETGMSAKSIARAAAGQRNRYARFYWSYDEQYDYHKPKLRFKKGAVLKCDKEGNVLKRYETPEELRDDGYRQISVNRVCRGERHEYKGYSWRHE